MMSGTLVLVRHGQSEWNLKNLFTCCKNPDLTEVGIEEARSAGRRLKAKGINFERAFTSALKRAQEMGDPKSMTLLGELYSNALGIKRDDAKAAEWYKQAAERGDREAMFALGMMKIAGRDGPANRQEGIDFLRWLEERHFTFLGARDYDLKRDGDAVTLIAKPDSGLGILRGTVQTAETRLPPEAVALIKSDELVLATKAMTRATVHRPAWLDYIAVKRFDNAGNVVGEARFLGLYTSTAYSASVSEIPQVRRRATAVMATAGMYEHSGDWLYDVGLPGKSGIGGGIVTVSPGKGGLGSFSPRLDAAGNSVRGVRAAARLASELGLGLFMSRPE